MEWMLELMNVAQSQPLSLGLSLLALACCVEYLFPPFPGDAVVLVGAVLMAVAGWPWYGVFAATVAGSVVGAALTWWLGRWLTRRDKATWIHSWLQRDGVRPRVASLKAKFARHGSLYIVLNRFLPAFRALFFLVAGMAGLRLERVLVCAAISAVLWNGVLLLAGASVGYNLEALRALVERYTTIVWGAIIIGVVLWIVVRYLRPVGDQVDEI